MFKLFYYTLLLFFYIIFLPILLLLSLKEKYKISIFKRFFPINNSPFKEERVWFHVCSYGETKAIEPILENLDEKVNISTITATGFYQGKKNSDEVRFLPFEIFLPFWLKKQKLLVVLEAELWFMLFLISKMKKTPTILLNARISDKSYKSYQRFSFLYKKIFENIDHIYAQSEEDKKRLLSLGGKNIEVLGNIKLFADIKIKNKYKKPLSLITTAASTHEGEEELIFNAWIKTKKGRLIVVPRHPERFPKVKKYLKEQSTLHHLSFNAFSDTKDLSSDITLVDAMGELNEIYAISDLVILGGAFFPKIGGHNFVEPATFACKIITGPHFFNQNAIFPFIENIKVVNTQEELASVLKNVESLKKTSIKNRPDIRTIKEKILRAKNNS